MTAIRFVELAAFLRVIFRREFTFSKLNRIDKLLLWLFAYTTVVFLLRSTVNQANKIGEAVDAYLCYFAFRGLLGGMDDFRWFLRKFLLLLTPYVGLLLIERLTGNNLFTSMGGIINGGWIRDGRLRCQGSFRQASLLGMLGASFLPIYAGLWLSNNDRKLATFAIILCLMIVWASNSGGPVMSTLVAGAGWMFWTMRTKMKLVRTGMVVGFVGLTLTMDAPVWYLLARLGSITGGSGWHRARLMDMAFQHLNLWWLNGMAIKDTADWLPYVLWITGGADITNQYLVYGIDAGLVAMFLFIALLIYIYKNLGAALSMVRQNDTRNSMTELLLWGLGVMLTAHCFNWLSIIYFDQTYVLWYFQLAVIVNLTEECFRRSTGAIEFHNRENEKLDETNFAPSV